jgi:monothiol glutaredoxin
MNEALKKQIESEIQKSKVVIFMKGTPQFPMCGFSARAIQLLTLNGAESFHHVNILENDLLREGIKEFSNWPTLPQIFVKGAFVGGCDILMEMHESGELRTLLKEAQALEAEKHP